MSQTDGIVGSGGYTYRVGEVSWTAWEKYLYPGQSAPASLQKLVRVPR